MTDSHTHDAGDPWDDLSRHIGEIVAAFGYMEGLLAAAVGAMINERDSAGAEIAMNYLTFSAKVNLFNDLIDLRFPGGSKREDLKVLVRALLKAGKSRNTVAHALWYCNAAGKFSCESGKTKVYELFEWGVKPFHKDQFAADLALISQTAEDLESFRSYYWRTFTRKELGLNKDSSVKKGRLRTGAS